MPTWPHAQPRQPPTPPTQPLLSQQGPCVPPTARPLPSQPFEAPSAHQTPKGPGLGLPAFPGTPATSQALPCRAPQLTACRPSPHVFGPLRPGVSGRGVCPQPLMPTLTARQPPLSHPRLSPGTCHQLCPRLSQQRQSGHLTTEEPFSTPPPAQDNAAPRAWTSSGSTACRALILPSAQAPPVWSLTRSASQPAGTTGPRTAGPALPSPRPALGVI